MMPCANGQPSISASEDFNLLSTDLLSWRPYMALWVHSPMIACTSLSIMGISFAERRSTVETSSQKVLVVDDERTTADTLALIFSQSGFDTRAAYSAEQALEIIARWQPDLAILDVVLPKMHGIDLTVLLTKKLPKCQTLLFSGQPLTADLLAEAEKKAIRSPFSRSPSILPCCWILR
jgi:CheY-like chemotaxis protein